MAVVAVLIKLGALLILALWLKEVPFLLWVAATQMQREDLRRRWQAEYALAQTLGRTPAQAFAQIIWPQLAPRLRWPLLAVLAYGLTVVDMALIIGPATPPTLGVLAWQWLSDADLLTQSQGVAAAGWLTGTVLVSGPGAQGCSQGKVSQRLTSQPGRAGAAVGPEDGIKASANALQVQRAIKMPCRTLAGTWRAAGCWRPDRSASR